MMGRILGFAVVVSIASQSFQAFSDAFSLQTLPRGKEVTLPRRATAIVPVSDRVNVASTDLPQSLKLSNVGGTKVFRVAIFDRNATSVRKIDIKPGTSYLYNFNELGTIALLPESLSGAHEVGQSLQIESNKPMSVSH